MEPRKLPLGVFHLNLLLILFIATLLAGCGFSHAQAGEKAKQTVTENEKPASQQAAAPVTAAAEPTVAAAAPFHYAVKRGESIPSVVRQFISHTSYMTGLELEAALREANNKPKGNNLKPGEDLIIPGYETGPIVEHSVAVPKNFEVRAIYLTGTMAGSDHGIRIIRHWHELGGNAVVFDIKDSDGSINIAFDHPMAPKNKHHSIANLPKFIRFLHSQNMHAIARVALFRDEHIARDYPELAVQSKRALSAAAQSTTKQNKTERENTVAQNSAATQSAAASDQAAQGEPAQAQSGQTAPSQNQAAQVAAVEKTADTKEAAPKTDTPKADAKETQKKTAKNKPAQNKTAPQPWRENGKLVWADASNPKVQDYDLALAKYVASSGADEIQFDYVRFPAEGDQKDAQFMFMKTHPEWQRADVIADFLSHAYSELHPSGVLLSLDVFGVMAWQRSVDLNHTGQDIVRMAKYCDVLSPMIYPSHFFGMDGYKRPGDAPEHFISTSMQRFEKITQGSGVVVRPWLQAFGWRTLTYSPQYIETQVKVAKNNGGIGFLFWNARNDYGRPFTAMPEMTRKTDEYFQTVNKKS